jgi:hypothetical protein
LPLPQIGLPLPRIGLQPLGTTPAPTVQHRGTSAPARGIPRSGGRTRRPAAIYFIPTGALAYPAPPTGFPSTPWVREDAGPPTGSVRLELQPGVDPQLFVDGYYVGTLNDVGRELTLEAGPHTLDLAAEGYERLQFGVQIPAGRSITYRGTLKAFAVAPAPRATAAAPLPPPATIYVIPGCYVGNVPPSDAHLPAGCDAALATTLQR